MLAQIVAYQIKAYEYRACLEEMVKNPPRAQADAHPRADRRVGRSTTRTTARPRRSETEKKYAEATRLLKEVIARHPKTPWADLAQDELNRGFGVQRNEWHHNPQVRRTGQARAQVLRGLVRRVLAPRGGSS